MHITNQTASTTQGGANSLFYIDQNKEKALHPLITKILRSRNFSDNEILEFFSTNLHELPEFSQLKDIQKAAQKIVQVMSDKGKIAIYGDYDVDGTTSCGLLCQFFRILNYQATLYQPSRFVEGYGLHPSGIQRAVEENVDLLITVDCGITNHEACDEAKKQGLDVIITDHHADAAPTMPDAYAVLNPNRRDEQTNSPLKFLAGVGVAFALSLEVRKIRLQQGLETPSLYPLLQYVAIGTICDLVKLVPANLKLVRHGLKQLPKSQFVGLRTFLTPAEQKKDFIPSEKLSFQIGPLINSKGRLDHPEMALKLLVAQDAVEARSTFLQLENCNQERKFIQKQVFTQAYQQIKNEFIHTPRPIAIAYQEDWHEGVIGIVASKLVENFSTPAIVFTAHAEDKSLIKGSARTAGSLDIFSLLNDNRSLFEKFGGHKAAAGLTLPKANLGKLKLQLINTLKQMDPSQRTTSLSYDIDLSFHEITPSFVRSLNTLEPFGQGNPKPLFKMSDAQIHDFKILKDVHVKWTLKSQGTIHQTQSFLSGISFNYIGKWNQYHPSELVGANKDIDIYFSLGINEWNNKEFIQLQVERIQFKKFPS